MRYSLRHSAIFIIISFALALNASRVEAGVAVLANNTDGPVHFVIITPAGQQQNYMLDRADVIPVPVSDKLGIVFDSDGQQRRYQLHANTIHHFVAKDKTLDLRTYILPAPTDEDPNFPPPKPRNVDHKIFSIPVKLLVDDDQPAVQKIWEKELRQRIADASDIFEHCCGVRFEVKSVETWKSDNIITDFQKSLQEFEAKVNPAPAQVAIGFTSQYEIPHGLTHLGGTRGPLYPYIIIREWSQHVTRSERLEILVHELGHLLGASHSAEIDSVMRPKLGDRRSHSTSFRIGFDPLNTLAMNILADELRAGTYHGFASMPLNTKRILKQIYLALGKELPKDPAASMYVEMLNMPALVAVTTPPPKLPELVVATQAVVQAVVEAARLNRRAFTELKGDGMTEYLVRTAASEAVKFPPPIAAKAFLLGIGIALDDSKQLREFPALGDFIRQVESDDARENRLSVLGKTTMFNRHDHAQHFAISSALAVRLGPTLAEQSGIAKELSDAHGESGFSFINLSADMSGVTFATQVQNGKITLNQLENSFKIRDFALQFDDLKENISWDDFTKQYGSINDPRFLNVRNQILKRIQSLPSYKNIDFK